MKKVEERKNAAGRWEIRCPVDGAWFEESNLAAVMLHEHAGIDVDAFRRIRSELVYILRGAARGRRGREAGNH